MKTLPLALTAAQFDLLVRAVNAYKPRKTEDPEIRGGVLTLLRRESARWGYLESSDEPEPKPVAQTGPRHIPSQIIMRDSAAERARSEAEAKYGDLDMTTKSGRTVAAIRDHREQTELHPVIADTTVTKVEAEPDSPESVLKSGRKPWVEVRYRIEPQKLDRLMVAQLLEANSKTFHFSLRPLAGNTKLSRDDVVSMELTDETDPYYDRKVRD